MAKLLGLLFLSVCVSCVEQLSINFVTVLLPAYVLPNGFPTSVVLEATGGCFVWKSNEEKIAVVEPNPNFSCTVKGKTGTTRATLSTVPARDVWGRKSSYIIAHDLSGRGDVECEVFVDIIARLEILTSTRRVNVGEKESLDLQAFDQFNNVFSTLEGLEFRWWWPEDQQRSILGKLSFASACMDVTPTRMRIEANGLETDRLPVEGISPGQLNVTVECKDPTHPVATTVEFSVFRPLELSPTIAFVAPCSTLTYTLKEKNRPRQVRDAPSSCSTISASSEWLVVSMPHTDYGWSASEKQVALADQMLGVATALRLGSAKVIVSHKLLKNHTQKADLKVLDPVSLHVDLVPSWLEPRPKLNGWWIIAHDSDYTLAVRVLDENGECMHGDNYEFELSMTGGTSGQISSVAVLTTEFVRRGPECPYFKVKIKATSLGLAKVRVVLKDVTHGTCRYKTTVPAFEQVFNVTERLSLPNTSTGKLLPFRPSVSGVASTPHSIVLTSEGGSGHYNWSSDSPDVIGSSLAAVKGMARPSSPQLAQHEFFSLQQGSSQVMVTDAYNGENFATARVVSSPVGSPRLLDGLREILVGNSEQVLVAAEDPLGRRFDNCSGLRLTPSLFYSVTMDASRSQSSSPAAFVLVDVASIWQACPDDGKPSCWVLRLKAIDAGFVGLRVDLEGLETSQTFTSFNPLRARLSTVVIASGFSSDVSADAGQLPWPRTGFLPLTRLPNVGDLSQHLLTVSAVVHVAGSWDAEEGRRVSVTKYAGSEAGVTRSATGLLSVKPHASDPYRFTLTCLDYHPQAIALEIQAANALSVDNPLPVTTHAYVKVFCYPPLRLAPDSPLELGVGATLPVTVVPPACKDWCTGQDPLSLFPLLQNVTFSVDHPSIAIASSRGLVHGLALGKTLLRAAVSSSDATTFVEEAGLHAAVVVLVKFAGFRVRFSSTSFLQGRPAFAFVEGSNGELPSDSIFDSLDVEWVSESPFLRVLPPLSELSPSRANSPRIRGPTARLLGMSPGRHVVSVRVAVRDPGQGAGDSSLTRVGEPTVLIARAEVEVLEPLTLLSPAALLLTPGAVTRLRTSLDDSNFELDYQVLLPISAELGISSEPLITVSSRGVLRVAAAAGRLHELDAVVLIRTRAARDNQTVQSVSVLVAVRAVAQLAAYSVPLLSGPLCEGSNATLRVVLLDSLGRVFHALDSESRNGALLAVKSNRPQVLRVQSLSEPGPGQRDGPAEQALRRQGASVEGASIYVSLSASSAEGPAGFASAVLKLEYAQTSAQPLLPLYVRLDVAPPQLCLAPMSAFVTMLLNFSATEHTHPSEAAAAFREAFPLYSTKRKAAADALRSDMARALGLPESRVLVRAVNVSSAAVTWELLSEFHDPALNAHPDQWHLALAFEQPQLAQVTDPFHMAQVLQAQVADPASLLRTGEVTLRVSALGLHISRTLPVALSRDASSTVPLWSDESIVEPQSAPSSLLSPSGGESSAHPADGSDDAAGTSRGMIFLLVFFVGFTGFLLLLALLRPTPRALQGLEDRSLAGGPSYRDDEQDRFFYGGDRNNASFN